MKRAALLSPLALCLLLNLAPQANSQGATVQVDPLPKSGTYYIVNSDTKEALQPVAAMVGQNVFAHEANNGGLQKWTVTRKIDPKTKKPLNRYTIRLSGENGDLWLQPFPAPDHTCMVSSGASDFSLAPVAGAFQIKSAALNGDALYTFPAPPGDTEARFGPAESAQKFQWEFNPVQ